MPTIRQTNFSGGELDPLLWGRTDLGLFGVGLRRCRNFFVSRAGAAVSRPGTSYVGAAKGTAGNIRLIPFVAGDDASFVLEMGDSYVRFHRDGETVMSPNTFLDMQAVIEAPSVGEVLHGTTSTATGTVVSVVGSTVELSGVAGTFLDEEAFWGSVGASGQVDGTGYEAPFELATQWTSAHLPKLRFAQTGDVLTLVHPDEQAWELAHTGTGDDDWALTQLSFAVPEWLTAGNAWLMSPLHSTAEADHPPRAWQWKVSVVAKHTTTGQVFETKPLLITTMSPTGGGSQVAVDAEVVCYPDRVVRVEFTPLAAPDHEVLAYRVYRGRGGLFGWVGDSDAGVAAFVDVGLEPDYALTPPEGRNPFVIANAAGVTQRTELPCTVTFFEERRVFGGTFYRPGYLFLSQCGDYANFDYRPVPLADEALFFELASRRREEIRHLLGVRRLLVFTSASVWAVGGAGGEAVAPDSIDAKMQAEVGCAEYPAPLTVDGDALYVRTKGTGARAISYDENRGGYGGVDLSAQAKHLVVGADKGIRDWCYAEDPWGLVWAVREDGQLLSLTYSPGAEAWGWARHDTDGDVVAICCVPEAEEDAVYLVVDREVTYAAAEGPRGLGAAAGGAAAGRYIERLGTRVDRGGLSDCVALDCVATYSGTRTRDITGLEHLEGKEVYAVGKDNPVQGPYTVEEGAIRLGVRPTANDGTDVTLHVGLEFTPELETLDVAQVEGRLREKTVVSVGFEVDESRGLEAGQDFDNLVPWRQRDVVDSYGPVSAATELVEVHVPGKWDKSARAALRQTWPLPVSVLGIARKLAVGGGD